MKPFFKITHNFEKARLGAGVFYDRKLGTSYINFEFNVGTSCFNIGLTWLSKKPV